MFYPHFLKNNLNSIGMEEFKQVYKFFIENSCKEETPQLKESSLEIGIEILQKYSSDYAESIAEIFEDYLENSKIVQEQINSLIFISKCVSHIKKKEKV
jgi:hypothetical protein